MNRNVKKMYIQITFFVISKILEETELMYEN